MEIGVEINLFNDPQSQAENNILILIIIHNGEKRDINY
jgi:hypothetical protein